MKTRTIRSTSCHSSVDVMCVFLVFLALSDAFVGSQREMSLYTTPVWGETETPTFGRSIPSEVGTPAKLH